MATQIEADRALEYHGDALVAHPNVSKISVRRDEKGVFYLEVGLMGDEQKAAREHGDAPPVPDELPIPSSDGSIGSEPDMIRIEKLVVGRLSTKGLTKRETRPVSGGSRCGPATFDATGTLGAMVKKGETPFILSCWHVFYAGKGVEDTPISQPSKEDGGKDPEDTIAYDKHGILDEYLDAAIAKVRHPAGDYVTSGTSCYGAINGTSDAALDMKVKICGGTSGKASGKVLSLNATVKLHDPDYPKGWCVFKDQIEMNEFTLGGDSGSVVLTEGDKATGILIGGGGGTDYANKIGRVLDAFGITIA